MKKLKIILSKKTKVYLPTQNYMIYGWKNNYKHRNIIVKFKNGDVVLGLLASNKLWHPIYTIKNTSDEKICENCWFDGDMECYLINKNDIQKLEEIIAGILI